MPTENTKILNIQKLCILLLIYQLSSDASTGNPTLKLNNKLIRSPYKKLLESEKFSDLDDTILNWLASFDSIKFDFTKIKPSIEKIISNNSIPDEDKPLFQKFGIKSLDVNSLTSGISDALINQSYINTVWKLFIEGVNLEIQKRRKKLDNIGVSADRSVDDSLLIAFKKKIEGCKTFNDIEDLLLLYTTTIGCDLINGFLRGDMSAVKSKKIAIKSSWGNDLHVSFDVLLDSAIKALELKKELKYGELENNLEVYKGLSIERFFEFIRPNDCSASFKSQDGDYNTKMKTVVDYLNKYKPTYSTKDITSTSTDRNIAIDWHASRHTYPVLMEILLTPGVSFGKDFSKTSFGTDDYNKEVILKPKQKIKILEAHMDKKLIVTTCKTIK